MAPQARRPPRRARANRSGTRASAGSTPSRSRSRAGRLMPEPPPSGGNLRRRSGGRLRPPPRCRWRSNGRASRNIRPATGSATTAATTPGERHARGAGARRPEWSMRTGHSRRARHRPAGRPRPGRHSRRADSRGLRARHRRRFRSSSRRSSRPAQAGAAASTMKRRRDPALPIRLERVACSTWNGAVIPPSSLDLREQAFGPHRQNERGRRDVRPAAASPD